LCKNLSPPTTSLIYKQHPTQVTFLTRKKQSRPTYPSKGITFMRNDGRQFRFCRSKCHSNFKMKRQPRKLKWTKTHRAARGKEMIVDSSLVLSQFAKKRNAPVKYDRNLVAATVQAMERV